VACCDWCATSASLKTWLRHFDDARREFEKAASLAQNTQERDLLLRRAKECVGRVDGG
jgi:predicted RNA polymerase sigma factor